MKNFIALFFTLFLVLGQANAAERTPFTKIKYGAVLGWGNFIGVEIDLVAFDGDEFDSERVEELAELNEMSASELEDILYDHYDATKYVVGFNGHEYKEVIKRAKKMFGSKYECMMANHFVEAMEKLGIEVGETMDLEIYYFSWGHQVVKFNNMPVTAENLVVLKQESKNYCK